MVLGCRDMVVTHPSVGVVVYHRDLKALLIVRQFRPPVRSSLSFPIRRITGFESGCTCTTFAVC